MTTLSRRQFAALAATAAVAPFGYTFDAAAAPPITAAELIDLIKARLGVAWKPASSDGLKTGDPATVVTGVVTTSMATLGVLQQAVKAGANVIVTGQPVFYAKADLRAPVARGGPGAAVPSGAPAAAPIADPVFTAKNQLIDAHKLVIFRLNEHWRLFQPDPLARGMAQVMGWTPYQAAADPRRFDLPATTLDSLAATVRKKLQTRGGMRVVGDPRSTIRRVGLLPGSTAIQAALTLLPEVDAIIAGEVREWESVEYTRDVTFSGGRKGLILVGRVVSEEPGMGACAEWLKTLAPGLPVRRLPSGDPYWSPA